MCSRFPDWPGLILMLSKAKEKKKKKKMCEESVMEVTDNSSNFYLDRHLAITDWSSGETHNLEMYIKMPLLCRWILINM